MAAAAAAGADAVYFGLGALDMRSLATGAFREADLPDIAAFAKDHNLKTRLTVNAVLYDEDLSEARQTMLAAKKAGIDAVICSDIAAMMLAHEVGIPVHLSTQLNIANVEALKFYAHFADVAVLARELTLEQTAAITRAIDEQNICGPSGECIKIEIFCHGALCIAQSGRCFMSLHTRGKSANRGQCLQSCRRKYYIKDAERDIELQIDPQYVMSPKDLKTIGFFDKMVQSGARIFKIEGRARSPEYVRTTVQCYSQALQAVLDGDFTADKVACWDDKLAEVFNRGYWDGWYLGAHTPELASGYGSQATITKRFAGKCINFFNKASVAQFLVQADGFDRGTRLLVTGPTTGAVEFVADEIFDDNGPVNHATKGTAVRFPRRCGKTTSFMCCSLADSERNYFYVEARYVLVRLSPSRISRPCSVNLRNSR